MDDGLRHLVWMQQDGIWVPQNGNIFTPLQFLRYVVQVEPLLVQLYVIDRGRYLQGKLIDAEESLLLWKTPANQSRTNALQE